VPHSVLSDHCKFGEADPAPVNGNIWNLSLLELLASFNVKNLDDGLITSNSSHSDDVSFLVHQDAVGLHVSSVHFEVLGGVDNRDLLKV
jgi:hypothetical protein